MLHVQSRRNTRITVAPEPGGTRLRQDHEELYLCRMAFELGVSTAPAKQKAKRMHSQWSGIETRRSRAINDRRDGAFADVG